MKSILDNLQKMTAEEKQYFLDLKTQEKLDLIKKAKNLVCKLYGNLCNDDFSTLELLQGNAHRDLFRLPYFEICKRYYRRSAGLDEEGFKSVFRVNIIAGSEEGPALSHCIKNAFKKEEESKSDFANLLENEIGYRTFYISWNGNESRCYLTKSEIEEALSEI